MIPNRLEVSLSMVQAAHKVSETQIIPLNWLECSVPKRPGLAGLSGGSQMRAGPGLAAYLGGLAAFLGSRAAFLGGLSLNRIFCSKDSLLPLLRQPPKYET
jgi:hypothetical protein